MINQKVLNFYQDFRNSKAYNRIMFLIILVGLMYYPLAWPEGNPIAILTGKYLNIFIIGPYILLLLMFAICLLYKNILLYIFILLLLIPNLLLLLIGLIMGGETANFYDYALFLVPIIVFLIINISTAIFTYKYKVETYNYAKKEN